MGSSDLARIMLARIKSTESRSLDAIADDKVVAVGDALVAGDVTEIAEALVGERSDEGGGDASGAPALSADLKAFTD